MISIEQYRIVVRLCNHVFNKLLRKKPLEVGPRYVFYPHVGLRCLLLTERTNGSWNTE